MVSKRQVFDSSSLKKLPIMTIEASTRSVIDQKEVEDSLLGFLRVYAPDVVAIWGLTPADEYCDPNSLLSNSYTYNSRKTNRKIHPTLSRRQHLKFLQQCLNPSSWVHEMLYMSQTWVIFWAVQAAEILGVLDELFVVVSREHLVELLFLHIVEEPAVGVENGWDQTRNTICGFAGSPRGKGPHLLATFAACCALCILDVNALSNLPRESIKRFILSLRNEDGSFRTYFQGEADLRCSYTAAVITSLLGLDEPSAFPLEANDIAHERILIPQVASYIASCQTHEGGFACLPFGCEAHGSYTFCGLGALFIMQEMHRCYLPSLLRWLSVRQMSFEGGFNGRTNKLVDACYSFWVGASHAMIKAEYAYRKLMEYSTMSPSSSSSENRCMLAKELSILHYVQLIDLEGCAVTDEALWEEGEGFHAMDEGMVDEFLSTDDMSCASVASRIATRKEACRKLYGIFPWVSGSSGDDNNKEDGSHTSFDGDFFFDQRGLQRFILACCQENEKGGLRDKPDVSCDVFHTCYALAGLSLSQNHHYADLAQCSSAYVQKAFERGFLPSGVRNTEKSAKGSPTTRDKLKYGVVPPYSSSLADPYRTLVSSINPVFNIKRSKIQEAWKLWGLRKTLR